MRRDPKPKECICGAMTVEVKTEVYTSLDGIPVPDVRIYCCGNCNQTWLPHEEEVRIDAYIEGVKSTAGPKLKPLPADPALLAELPNEEDFFCECPEPIKVVYSGNDEVRRTVYCKKCLFDLKDQS